MIKRLLLLALPFPLVMCDFGPAPLNLGEAPRTNDKGELTLPLNVTKAFSPTGYFYNVWPPADSTFTQVDPEKWNNFLAYQSVYHHPACADRVPIDSLVKYDLTLPAFVPPARFYDEFSCAQFTYAPAADDDLYGGVFWLRGNNFGNQPGVQVDSGAKVVKFWARSLNGGQRVTFGVGVNNSSVLKPWYYFSPFVDTWGKLDPFYTPLWTKERVLNSETGLMVDTVVARDSVLEGSAQSDLINLTDKWTLYTLDLGILYAFNLKPDTVKSGPEAGTVNMVPFEAIPDHRLIGAFFWAMEAAFVNDKSRISAPITLPDGSKRHAKFGAATILIDGIRYE